MDIFADPLGGHFRWTSTQVTSTTRVTPFHSNQHTSNRYHVCSNCFAARHVKPENRVEGTGNRPICERCRTLIAEGEC